MVQSTVFGGEALEEVLYQRQTWQRLVTSPVSWLLDLKGYCLARRVTFDPRAREEGEDWPAAAETMIGLKRLTNLETCAIDVLSRQVPGDFIETGVWRGGACIFMRAVLKAYGDKTRRVWVADSFEGLPKPVLQTDKQWRFWRYRELCVSQQQVEQNFSKYGLLDEQVRFLKGWFKDTLTNAPIETLSLMRLDGDLYESTRDALCALYPRLSQGGYVIIDDYVIPSCREAVEDYRKRHQITDPIQAIDKSGIYWKKYC